MAINKHPHYNTCRPGWMGPFVFDPDRYEPAVRITLMSNALGRQYFLNLLTLPDNLLLGRPDC